MRSITLLFILFLGAYSAAAQKQKTYTVNSIKDNKEELVRDVYRYPQFAAGLVVYKDGISTEAQLNYDRHFDQVLFLGPKGDTLALARPELYKYVTIGADTFHIQEKGFLELMTHYKGVNLSKKNAIKFVGLEKKGLYGTYSSTASAESRNEFSVDGGVVSQKVQVDQNSVYRTETRYFLSDEFNNFFPATKKHFYNLFFNKEKELRAYLDQHDVNFNKEKDLLELVTFLQGQ